MLTAFQERAKRVSAGLGARDYEMVSLSIQTPGGGGPVPMMQRAEMMMDKVPAPSFESGQSTLQVRVDATIELGEVGRGLGAGGRPVARADVRSAERGS